jgi:hypothetical protein
MKKQAQADTSRMVSFACRAQKSLQQRTDNVANIQRSNVSIGLSYTHENDGLTSGVHHGYSCPYLVIDSVELCQHNAINFPGSLLVYIVRSVLDKSLIETPQLVHPIIANEGFTDK